MLSCRTQIEFYISFLRGKSKPKLDKCSQQLCSYHDSSFHNHLHFSLLSNPILNPNPNPNPQHKPRTQSQGILITTTTTMIIMTIITGPPQISIAAFVARTQLISPAPNKTQMSDFPIIISGQVLTCSRSGFGPVVV